MTDKSKKTIVLTIKSPIVRHLCNADQKLGRIINEIGSITYRLGYSSEESFSFLVREIIEQMLSKKSGTKIYNRLVDLCNGDVTPTAISKLSFDEIKSIGTSTAKVKYIQCLTKAVQTGDIDFAILEKETDEIVLKKLTKLNGIGSWTAKMYLIFILGRENILPYEDAAFIQAYRKLYPYAKIAKSSILKNTKKWEPFRSIASRYMYIALDTKVFKNKV